MREDDLYWRTTRPLVHPAMWVLTVLVYGVILAFVGHAVIALSRPEDSDWAIALVWWAPVVFVLWIVSFFVPRYRS
jgi:hypothetical protein